MTGDDGGSHEVEVSEAPEGGVQNRFPEAFQRDKSETDGPELSGKDRGLGGEKELEGPNCHQSVRDAGQTAKSDLKDFRLAEQGSREASRPRAD